LSRIYCISRGPLDTVRAMHRGPARVTSSAPVAVRSAVSAPRFRQQSSQQQFQQQFHQQ
jgi:hypothetical protein